MIFFFKSFFIWSILATQCTAQISKGYTQYLRRYFNFDFMYDSTLQVRNYAFFFAIWPTLATQCTAQISKGYTQYLQRQYFDFIYEDIASTLQVRIYALFPQFFLRSDLILLVAYQCQIDTNNKSSEIFYWPLFVWQNLTLRKFCYLLVVYTSVK